MNNLHAHFSWKKSSWMMIRSKRVRFYFETWRVQTDVRLGWFTRPLHPTTALVSFKPILHACREFGRFFRYLAMLHSNSGFENILHIQVTSNHCSCDFQTHLTGMEFGIPLGYFEEILCGHVTSKFWFWEFLTYPSFNPSSMQGTLLRNFENIWHIQGTFDPATALLS